MRAYNLFFFHYNLCALTNWKFGLAPAPASPFLSGPPGPRSRRYAARSSPIGARGPLSGPFGLGRAPSGRVWRLSVAGTISGGR